MLTELEKEYTNCMAQLTMCRAKVKEFKDSIKIAIQLLADKSLNQKERIMFIDVLRATINE